MLDLIAGKASFRPLPAAPARIVAEGGRLTRGLNLVGNGESAYFGPPDGVEYVDLDGWRILAGGEFKHLGIGKVRGDFRGKRSDGIGLSCNALSVSVDGVRLTGFTGEEEGFHGDGIQLQLRPDGSVPTIGRLSITNTTIASGYQAIFSGATPDGRGVREIFIDRVNIRDEPDLRKQPGSIAMMLGDLPGKRLTGACEIILGPEVYVDWPIAEKALLFHPTARVSGSIRHGRPPGGDFCPA